MTRREQRIKKIRARISNIDKAIPMLERALKVTAYPKRIERRIEILLDRRDKWEERLVSAELG